MRKTVIILVSLVAIILISATVLADVSWKTIYSSRRELAQASSIGAEWGYTFSNYPLILHEGNYGYGGDLSENSGTRLFVTKPTGEEVPLIEVYTGAITLWSGGSYFVIKGASIYSNFPEQKYTIDQLVTKYGDNGVYNKILPYYFPSEDRKVFKLEIEVDDSGGNELVVHKVYLEDQATFESDLSNYFKSNGKVPVDGATVVATLTLVPSSFEKTKTAKVGFSFKAPEAMSEGYKVYISKATTAKTEVDKAVTELTSTSDWISTKVDELAKNSTALAKDASVSAEVSASDKIALLNGRDKGKYLAVATNADSGNVVAASFLEIIGEGESPSGDCSSILSCLASLDKKFVDGVFE